MMGAMAGRLPLLLAAALFVVGAGGFLVTMPGGDTAGAFVPMVRPQRTATPTAPALVRDLATAIVELPTATTAPVTEAPPDYAVVAGPNEPAPTKEPSPTPTPSRAGAVAAAVASDALEDPDATPTRAPLRAIMVARDAEAEPTPGASDNPAPEPSASQEPVPGAIQDAVTPEPSSAE